MGGALSNLTPPPPFNSRTYRGREIVRDGHDVRLLRRGRVVAHVSRACECAGGGGEGGERVLQTRASQYNNEARSTAHQAVPVSFCRGPP